MSLLDGPQEMDYNDKILQQFLLPQNATDSPGLSPEIPYLSKQVKPTPGFCLKTKMSNDEKVFINVCHSEELPEPPDISDEELIKITESQDPSRFRVPISLGEPHAEVDHSGKGCSAYDVIVNSEFYKRTQNRPVLKDFLLTLTLEGLEQKFNIVLSRDCKILKNKKFLGSAETQHIRQKPKPSIIEVEPKSDATTKKPLITELDDQTSSTAEEPVFKIIREPLEGDAEFLIMEIQLPKLTTSKVAKLEVGEDRVVFHAHPNLYHLDIDLPYYVDNEEVGAQFNKTTKILTATIPVKCLAPF
ncbi:PIH1 domain-containing protein 1-like [Dysidea avara]|uniref:PIH1 domain-containing protein 1-like n=1 Tax=Dysidea avara TaxID=196820 RepID=UPI00331A1DCB